MYWSRDLWATEARPPPSPGACAFTPILQFLFTITAVGSGRLLVNTRFSVPVMHIFTVP